MDIVQILGVAFVSVFIILILKQYKPEFAIYATLISSVIIFGSILMKLTTIVDLLKNLSDKMGASSGFMIILIKITGIAYLTEFGSNICKDSGETAVASKVELAGKVMIIGLSIPILTTLIETIIKIMP